MKRIILAAVLFFLMGLAQCGAQSPGRRAPMGVWVSVFTQHKVLFSHKAAAELITTCSQAGVDEIYLQLFQSGRAYYDSQLLARDKYDEMVRLAGGDMIDYILKEAARKNIKVFAWVNLLSLGQNEQAQIVRQYGRGVLTRDQYSRPSGKKNPNETDDYYLREDQIFLEPGDPRVGAFLGRVVDEIAARYPGLSGVHLDYIRYPMTVPFSPGAKFSEYGINYGYGERNVERFRAHAGIDPLKGLGGAKDFESWDAWRRQQVTGVVRQLRQVLKKRNPRFLVSAAVVPGSDRAYTSMFQDWPGWLDEGLLDYVVLMSYTQDPGLLKLLIRSALGMKAAGKVYAGLGAFLMKDGAASIAQQYTYIQGLGPDGIVLFSYDDLTPEVIRAIADPSQQKNVSPEPRR